MTGEFFSPVCGYVGNMTPRLGTVKEAEASLDKYSTAKTQNSAGDYTTFYSNPAQGKVLGSIYNGQVLNIVKIGDLSCFAHKKNPNFHRCEYVASDI